MALANIIKQRQASGAPRTAGAGNLGGAAVSVTGKEVVDGKTVLRGTLEFDSLGRKAGEEVLVHFNERTAGQIEDNLKRGQGTVKESIILLENVLNKNGGTDNEVIARWITTARSGLKIHDDDSGHNTREVDRAFVGAPSLLFANPSRQKDEPEFLFFNVAEKTISRGNQTYTREFMIEKLSQVEDVKKVRVQSQAISPNTAVQAATFEDALKAVGETLEIPNGFAFVRASDSEGTVISNVVRKKAWDQPVADALKDLAAGQLIRNVNNADLVSEMENGNLTLEVIVGLDIPFLGDSRTRIIDGLVKKPESTLQGYTYMYGEKGQEEMVDAVIVTMPTKSGGGVFFAHDPVRLEGKRVDRNYIPSPVFTLTPPATEAPAAAAEATGEPAADAADLGGGDEAFDLTNYSFDAPTEAEADQMQQEVGASSAQNRRNNR